MIEVRDLNVRYGSVSVLREISFAAPKGEILAVVGPNGAGKSTLLRSVNRTIAAETAGEVFIDGDEVRSLSRSRLARRVAVVAQENETRFPITVREFVLAGRFAFGGSAGWESATDIERSQKAIADCGLSEFADRKMNDLSGGERQRVVLARALATEAPNLLLDEPTANLDLSNQALMFKLVRERCNATGATSIIVTHDLNLAAAFADHILIIKDGAAAAYGTPADVLTAETVRIVFDIDVVLDTPPRGVGIRVTPIY